MKKNTTVLSIVSKEAVNEMIPDKNKYMIISRDQDSRRRHNIETDNSSWNVRNFSHSEKNLEEIEFRNVCYDSVEVLSSSSFPVQKYKN